MTLIMNHDAKLLFTDTNSLVQQIRAEDVQEDFYEDKHLFDLSIYPKDAKLFDPNNEKVVGKTKDESRGEINDEFVGLKSKMYFIKDADGEEIKKQIESIKMLLKTKDIKNLLVFYLMKKQ